MMKTPLSPFRFIKTTFVFLTAIPLTATFIYAATLSDTEKSQKREELDRFFSEALIRTKAEAAKKVHQAFRFTATGTTRVGYDSNVDLNDSDEDGDAFHEQQAAARLEYAPESAAIFGHAVAVGVEGRFGYLGYFDRDDLNRQSGLASPYLRIEINPDMYLETAYQFKSRIYENREELSYLSNGVKTTLNHQITPGLTHKVFFRYEKLDYTDRKALLSGATFTGGDREDDRYEIAYAIRKRTGIWTFSLEGNWVWNDSNDEYFDYNDYDDGGLEGAVSARVTERTVITAFGGWHSRMYDGRKIAPVFDRIQEDDWYYTGGRIFYALNTWSGIDATLTYYANDSNDGNRDYDSVITSVGLHLYF